MELGAEGKGVAAIYIKRRGSHEPFLVGHNAMVVLADWHRMTGWVSRLPFTGTRDGSHSLLRLNLIRPEFQFGLWSLMGRMAT